jgi:superoxide dismutase, Cu-Zn family
MKTIMKNWGLFIVILIPAFSGYAQTQKNMEMKDDFTRAICVLMPTQGNNVTGTITFTSTPDGVLVKGDIQGLTPGNHGFHIHEYGDCSSADGSSAGGHFNPLNMQHGAPMDMQRHEGDMGNVEADASGNAHIEYADKMITLNGPNSIIGRGVVVHKDRDDLKSQPAGNAGPRLACGVIGIAK